MKNLLIILLFTPILCNSQIGYWMLNDTTLDAAGSYNGTGKSITYKLGVKGDACVFAGTDSKNYITIPNVGTFTNGISVSCWVSTLTSGMNKYILTFSSTDDYHNFNMQMSTTNKFRMQIYNLSGGTSIIGTTSINDGKWHYVVGTFLSTNLILYVDGIQENSSSSVTATTISGNVNRIGDHISGVQTWNGYIDDVKLFNKVITAAYIKNEYALYKGFMQ